jgi:hypothetical protein
MKSRPRTARVDSQSLGFHPAVAELTNWRTSRVVARAKAWRGAAKPHPLAAAGFAVPNSPEPMTP